jgi:hypothetical protein
MLLTNAVLAVIRIENVRTRLLRSLWEGTYAVSWLVILNSHDLQGNGALLAVHRVAVDRVVVVVRVGVTSLRQQYQETCNTMSLCSVEAQTWK